MTLSLTQLQLCLSGGSGQLYFDGWVAKRDSSRLAAGRWTQISIKDCTCHCMWFIMEDQSNSWWL